MTAFHSVLRFLPLTLAASMVVGIIGGAIMLAGHSAIGSPIVDVATLVMIPSMLGIAWVAWQPSR